MKQFFVIGQLSLFLLLLVLFLISKKDMGPISRASLMGV